MRTSTLFKLAAFALFVGLIGLDGLRAQETESENGSEPVLGSGDGAEAGTGAIAPSGPAEFIGAERCGRCHRMDRTGDQLGQWQGTRHAQAFATLASPESAAIAAELGIADAQTAPECLRCHQTAFGADSALLGHDFDPSLGVQCESCHGAGSNYAPREIMRDREASLAAGMVIPDEALCRTCHNEESPTFQRFDYAAAASEIAHPNPEAAE